MLWFKRQNFSEKCVVKGGEVRRDSEPIVVPPHPCAKMNGPHLRYFTNGLPILNSLKANTTNCSCAPIFPAFSSNIISETSVIEPIMDIINLEYRSLWTRWLLLIKEVNDINQKQNYFNYMTIGPFVKWPLTSVWATWLGIILLCNFKTNYYLWMKI